MSCLLDIAGFEARYREAADPWNVFHSPDEYQKRDAIIEAARRGDPGHMLELGCGIGGHSVALAKIAERLDCIEATSTGVDRTRASLCNYRHTRVHQLTLPGRLPSSSYSTVVVSELLYYMSVLDMTKLAFDIGGVLARGGQLVLAHHYAHFDDAHQSGATIHRDFAQACACLHSRPELVARTEHWRVERFTRRRRPQLSLKLGHPQN
ncbi:MAG: SAM-dependent methyltransferase [Parvularcula sp.]|jgi:predicted TPR repeat methyltransferase|nr:SAM-dependent methyltransferase [Parvularcula sp.]